jgi:hypothetical protein
MSVCKWSDMQLEKGGPIIGNNAVDRFLAKGYTGRTRIYMGRWSPKFALAAGKVHMVDAYDHVEADCPRWWEPDVQALQKDFFNKFAAKYDGKIDAVFIANGGTIYAEPFMRGISDKSSRQNLLAAGYTPALDQASYVAGYNMAKVFKQTRIAQAFNNWQYVSADGNGHSDPDFTIQMMDKLASMFPRRAIWANNSIRTPSIKAYQKMYDHMRDAHTKGRPIGFQCATAPRIGSWTKTLDWAVAVGAHAVELSPGFSLYMTEAELKKYDTLLRKAA